MEEHLFANSRDEEAVADETCSGAAGYHRREVEGFGHKVKAVVAAEVAEAVVVGAHAAAGEIADIEEQRPCS